MRSAKSHPLRRSLRWCPPALLLLAAALPAGAAAATWRLEPIGATEGVAELHGLDFDAQGRGLLSWSALLRGHEPPLFGGLALRDPAGGWQRPPDLAGVEPHTVQLHHYSGQRVLLVAREAGSEDEPASSRRRLTVADGQSDGGFGPQSVLDEFTLLNWSAANAAGDAIIAHTAERTGFIRVNERDGGGAFSGSRDLALGTQAAVALNDAGDRVLVWADRTKRLAARTRRAGGSWGRPIRFGRFSTMRGMRLSALVAPGGRIVVTWGGHSRDCGIAVRDSARRWHVRRLERRCGPTSAPYREAPVLPFADSAGATYAVWTGLARDGRRSVKFARVDSTGPGRTIVLSRQRAAVLDDVAAGPDRALAVTWTAPRPTTDLPFVVATFAALRRGGAAFGRSDRLTPDDVVVTRGSRVAFQPLTGEPVVAIPFKVGPTVAVGAAVGPPPGPAPGPAIAAPAGG